MMNTLFGRSNRRVGGLLLVAVAGLALTSAAQGAPRPDAHDNVLFSDTRIVISVVDGREVKVTQRDGDTQVELDGKAVPASRFKVQDEWVTINDENGNEITKIMIGVPEGDKGGGDGKARVFKFKGGDGAIAIAPRGGGGMRAWAGQGDDAPKGGVMVQAESAPPKVMLGVTSTTVSDDLAQHLGVDGGTVLMIGSVVPDSPASAAGLKKGDVIVALNGKALDNAISLRDRLRDNNPGDEIALTVIQSGQKNEIKVKLVAYDGKKFTIVKPYTKFAPDVEIQGLEGLGQNGDHGAANHQQLAEELRRMAESMKELKGVDAEAMAKLRAEMAQLADEAAKNGGAMVWRFEGQPRAGGMNPIAPLAPQPPVFLMDRAGNGDTDARLRRLEEQMTRLEKLLEKSLEQQDKKNP